MSMQSIRISLSPFILCCKNNNFLPDFPGRKFRISSSCGFSKKEMKEMLAAEKKANLTVRNFPATVAELRKRLKLAEGGEFLHAAGAGSAYHGIAPGVLK